MMDLADYLDNETYFPFASNYYRLKRPTPAKLSERDLAFEFRFNASPDPDAGAETDFGYLDVALDPDGETIWVPNLKTRENAPIAQDMRYVGREALRRLACYAARHDRRYVVLLDFMPGAASFAYGLGFRPYKKNVPVVQGWRFVEPSPEAEMWKRRLADCPYDLWAFARTALGRQALALTDNSGVLDLQDETQRKIVAQCLLLSDDLREARRDVLAQLGPARREFRPEPAGQVGLGRAVNYN